MRSQEVEEDWLSLRQCEPSEVGGGQISSAMLLETRGEFAISLAPSAGAGFKTFTQVGHDHELHNGPLQERPGIWFARSQNFDAFFFSERSSLEHLPDVHAIEQELKRSADQDC